jgi:hypothetical protein
MRVDGWIAASRRTVVVIGYSHQGWLTPDQRYFLHDDESDNGPSQDAIRGRTRTRVFDVTDVEHPSLHSVYHGETRSPAHNHGRTAWGASWSNHPYFSGGVVAVSGLDGLFLVRPRLGGQPGRSSNVCLPG